MVYKFQQCFITDYEINDFKQYLLEQKCKANDILQAMDKQGIVINLRSMKKGFTRSISSFLTGYKIDNLEQYVRVMISYNLLKI